MQRFFEAVLEPIFRLENIRTIVEIGSDKGLNTVKLIRYANDVKGKVYSVDPSPRFDSETWAEENPESFVMFRDLSRNVIKNIKDADCFLIDGDHNWYTVYNELKMIYDTYGCDKFPLVFFHDIDWPYDRRDLYYSPENIPAVYRNEYEKKGLNPNSCLTSDNGINEQHFNAKRYGGEKNGVLTAVEDFIKDYPELDLRFMSHDVLFGLGMIASPKKYPEAIEYFYSSEALKKMMRIAEKERIDKQIKINALSRTLKEKKASEINPCIAKIYPDFGNGFNEESSVLTGDYNKESGEYYGKVVFEKPPALLRFDPVSDCFCIVDELSVTGKGGNIEIMDLNGLSFGSAYIFTNDDPQIIFKNTDGSKEFRIKACISPFTSIAALDSIKNLLSEADSLREKLDNALEENKNLTAENTGISDENKKISDENGILSENNKKLSDEKTALEADCRLKNLSVEALNKNCSAVKQTVDKYSNIAEKLFCSKGKTGWKYAVRCAVKKGLFAAGANVKAIRKIRKSGGFDVLYYCEKNRDVLEKGMDPLVHFIWFGGYEGRNPSSKFNASKYLSSYDDVRKSGINPYAHYLLYGEKEHRNPFAKKTNSAPIKNILPASDKKAFVKETIVADEPKDIKADLIAENSRALRKKDISVNGNPLVSIIIINHNGLKNLKTLFTSFREKDFYSNFEIIFVDNASTDNSIEYVKSLKEYKTTIIRNSVNESFSKANNQGIQAASGEYVLFLNNDLEVTDFWLDCLIHTAQQNADCGAVGSRLVYPYIPKGFINHNKSFKIQHMGIVYENSAFEDRHFIRPVNYKNGCEPFLSNLGGDEPYEISGVTAACMLVKKSVIEAVGGFDEEYVYGYEDCDLNLEIYRKGYKNYLCPCSLLFHYEFGTQNNSSREEIVKRRTNNIHHFMSKWQGYIRNMMWKGKLSDTSVFIGSDNPLTVAVVVTDDDPGTSAGDYFTGMELCTALQRRGCRTKFLALKKDNCYDVGQETDVLISLLEKFDLNQMYNYSPMLVTIAWARNWFDRWCKLPYINNFTYIFASSVTACDYMKNILNRDIELFPIATNDRRFNNYNVDRDNKSPFYSDYVFTGSYWGAPREIIDIIEPSEIPFDFKIFGANWDKIPKFRKHYKGFVNYVEMPDIYRNTRIVVDDANHVTKPYGAVNSRVFDALAAGRLVVTNGTIGAKETFEGLLPSFETKEEFEAIINKYLSDQDAYNKRVNELREFVLKNHTYDIRAKQLIEFLKKKLFPNEKKLALMIPVPKYEEAESWGDYHFAVAMKKQFERKGFTAEIRILPEWDMPFDGKYVIVLRGLSIYEPKKQHLNIMWNISHPDDIPLSEYEKYDKVYVSSEKWTEHLKMQLRTDVETLMQCTDEEVFCPPVKNEHKHQLLFVGNSRKVFRKIIKDLLPTPYSLSVYGTNWEKYIDSAYIKGKNIPNKELSAEYGSCDILLNDHWDDMREKGFVSNRIYDGLASGAFIITDEIDGMDDELNKCVAFYKDRNDLAEKVKYYMEHPAEREAMAEKGMKIVREKHTFRKRSEKIAEYIINQNFVC